MIADIDAWDTSHRYTAETIDDVEVGVIPRLQLEMLMVKYGDFAYRFAMWMSLLQRKTETKLRDLLMGGKNGALASTLIRLCNSFGQKEEDNIKIAFPMGVCMITEGVIPIAAVDLLRVVTSCTLGAAVGGGLSMMWNVGSPVPSGGMFIVPAMTHPLLFTLALFIGSTVTGVMLFLWKKEPVENQDFTMEEEEDEIDLSGIKIS